jgi:hypothetical protein
VKLNPDGIEPVAKTLPKGEHQANFVTEITHQELEPSVTPRVILSSLAQSLLRNRYRQVPWQASSLQQAGSDEGAEALYGKHNHKR